MIPGAGGAAWSGSVWELIVLSAGCGSSGVGPFGAEWVLTVEVQPRVPGVVLEGRCLQGPGSRALARGADARVKLGVTARPVCRICFHTQGQGWGESGVCHGTPGRAGGPRDSGRDAWVAGPIGLSDFTVVTFLLMRASEAPHRERPRPGQATWKEGELRACEAALALLGTCCTPSLLCCSCVGQSSEVWSQSLVF